ncbi:MAG: PQQ-like beta-propeller repeat protein [Bifidobacteriaceae bacterium]|nr:PQQ-like beta-propeller repeat protein [Bifidobacteriaceae bacterium]
MKRLPRAIALGLALSATAGLVVGCADHRQTPQARQTATAQASANQALTVLKSAPPDPIPAWMADPSAPIPLDQLPGYTPPAATGEQSFSRPMTGAGGDLTWRVIGQNDAETALAWGDGDGFSQVPGVLTFRGNNYRDAPAYGQAAISAKKLQIEWTHPITSVQAFGSVWPGAGWTGQPLLVNWPAETRAAMGLAEPFASDPDFVEVLYPVFGGVIHRLDLRTGAVTKPAIEGSCPFKGTGSIDPRGYPLLYAGQGLPDRNGTTCPWRYRIFDLIEGREVAGWPGQDPDSPRSGWGAFDSSALINAAADYLVEGGENGLIYKAKLNARFDPAAGAVTVDPQLTKLRFQAPSSSRHGVEGSLAAYRNLVFSQDNDGVLAAWDAITLTNVWARPVDDDADATIVVEPVDGQVGAYLYVGNEIDHRGSAGVTNLRKIDALTGELVWQYDVPAVYDQTTNGGLVATPMLGAGQAAGLVIFNVAKTAGNSGALVALDTATGDLKWRRDLANYSWSSPVGIMSTDGLQYGVFCDSAGLMHLFDPLTGQDFDAISIGANTEASPAVYGDMIVVANYSLKIYGVRVT